MTRQVRTLIGLYAVAAAKMIGALTLVLHVCVVLYYVDEKRGALRLGALNTFIIFPLAMIFLFVFFSPLSFIEQPCLFLRHSESQHDGSTKSNTGEMRSMLVCCSKDQRRLQQRACEPFLLFFSLCNSPFFFLFSYPLFPLFLIAVRSVSQLRRKSQCAGN